MNNLDNTVTLPTGITTITRPMLDTIREQQKQTRHFIIPHGVTIIKEGALQHCRFTTIDIPCSVTSIGAWTFSWCSDLTSITIPHSVTEIEQATFYKCSSLTSITLPNSVTKINKRAFEECRNLTSITIPDSVSDIEEQAFHYCTQLTSITIPDSVNLIGTWAFNGCTSITSITIPNSITSIGIGAFANCTSLTFAVIPKNLESKNENYWRERGINIEKTTLITKNQLSTWASSQKLSCTYAYHELAILYQLQKDDNFTPSWPELGKLAPNLLMDDLLEVLPKAKRNIVLPKTYINQLDGVCLENHSLFKLEPAESRQEHEQKADRLKNDGFEEYKNPDDPTKTIHLKEVSPAATSSILQWLTVKEVATLLNVKASSKLWPNLS